MRNPRPSKAEIQELLDELLDLAQTQSLLPCDCLRSVQAHIVRKYDIDGATLSFPLLGYFRYREQGQWVQANPGQLLVVPNARSIDIEYVPDAEAREFVALSVVLSDEQLEAARLLLSAPPDPDTGSIASVAIGGLMEPLRRWIRSMQDGQRALSLHAMVEVALRLYENGCTALLHPQPPSLAMQIRRLVARDPTHNWSSSEIEDLTGLSGPTLRRRMANESTTLRTVIADARISEALRMLMASRLPIKSIAARVGYNSVASFSRRFAERYGTEPAQFR